MSPGPAGNLYDRHSARNPIARRLTTGFLRGLDELLANARPGSIVDVGCGEGVVTERFARLVPGRVVGVDPGEGLHAEWRAHARPNLEFREAAVEALPLADGEFELAAGIELLEHVADPAAALRELARVASRHLLLSVPREPLWRVLNVARGAYWSRCGNTPGHVNHFSKRAFLRLAGEHGEVMGVRSPLPWTAVLVRLAR